MLFQLIKKQLLLLWRNPVQIFYLLGLPVILIIILSVALADFMQEGSPRIELKVAWLEHQNESEQIDRFMNEMKDNELSVEALEKSADLHMITMLKNDVFQGAELQEMIDLEVIQEDEKADVLENDSYSGLIEVPEDFTYDMLRVFSGQEDEKPELTLHVNQEDGVYSAVLSQILEQFDNVLTTQNFLQQNELDININDIQAAGSIGDQVQLEQMNPISSSDYYTVGMAVYLGLYVASTIAFFAAKERQDQVFDRIIVADMSRWLYFFGVLISSMTVAFIQLVFLFCFSYYVFQVTFDNIVAFLITTLIYAVSVGGIAVLLTAISYRLQSDTIIGFFSSIISSIFAFIGGSFYPIGEGSDTFQLIGNMTPNGSGLSAYIQLLRGGGVEDVAKYLIYMVVFGAVMIVVAAMSFPKRGSTR